LACDKKQGKTTYSAVVSQLGGLAAPSQYMWYQWRIVPRWRYQTRVDWQLHCT